MSTKEYRKTKDLKLWEQNPRSIRKEDFERLKKQIQELGQYKPLIITKDGEVIGGNMRLRAYRELGIEDVWVSVVDPKDDMEKLKYALSDNDRAGYYDDDLLANLSSAFPDFEWSDYAVDLTPPETLDKVLFKEEVQEDEVPEVSDKEPISKLGEVYQLGRHKLMCGDSTKIEDVEKLMNGQKADMVFTDPPYGMDLDTDYTSLSWGDRKGKKYDRVIGDDKPYDPTHIFNFFGYVEEIFLWGADYYYDLIPNFKDGNYIVWDKTLASNGDADSNSEYELLWSKSRHKREVMHFNWFRYFGLSAQDGDKRIHPTQKPLQVITPVLSKHSKEDGVIVDLFGGSGSTLIACEQLNRTCYMMEIDPKYCDVIRKRYARFIGKEDEWEKVSPKVQ
jgi:DNA modification methylase